MRIIDIRAYEGSNIHSYQPLIEMKLDLEELAEKESKDIESFNLRLLKCLPGLFEHYCSLGKPGGFVKRLEEGTYLGHIIEHVALELSNLAGHQVYYGKTRCVNGSVYNIFFEYICKDSGIAAARAAVVLVEGILQNKSFSVHELVEEIRAKREFNMGPSTEAIIEAARERAIPVIHLGEGVYQLGYGRYRKLISASITSKTGCIGVDIAGDKPFCKKLLGDYGIPVAPGKTVQAEDEAIAYAQNLGCPVVLKPYNGNHGKGVSLNLKSEQEIRQAYKLANYYSDRIFVEKYIHGKQFRLLVIGGRLAAAAQRIPPYVRGDGKATVKELVLAENQNPLRGNGHEKVLTKIKLDAQVLTFLARQDKTADYVPAEDEIVYLRDNANLSSGGTSIDVTDEVHPDIVWMAVYAANLVGLDIAGIDLVAEDISLPLKLQKAAVIEVNAAPGLRMHLSPGEGQPRPVGRDVVNHLFPPDTPYKIPVVSITGTNGKTTTTRMVEHILKKLGNRVGMTTTDGIYIGGKRIIKGDCTGPVSARTVLTDPTVDAVVLETARGGILRAGLGYDSSDIGVITNISEDHLGQNGIDTIKQLADVKSLIIETVKPDGYAVLNADDPQVVGLSKKVRSKLIYFSLKPDNLVIRRHLAVDGKAVFVKNGMIIFSQGKKVKRIVSVKKIPSALKGRARHNVQNALAAAACCAALNIPLEAVQAGLLSFNCDMRQNPGRLNIMELNGIKVIIDYAHNAAGYESMLHLLHQLKGRRLIGVIAVPGNRLDEYISQVGHIAGSGFNRLVIKEDFDLRGRACGEVSSLLREGALKAGLAKDHIEIILDEEAAVMHALEVAVPGDIVAVFYENLDKVLNSLTKAQIKLTAWEKTMLLNTSANLANREVEKRA